MLNSLFLASVYAYNILAFLCNNFLLGFTSCKTEQPLLSRELCEKEDKYEKHAGNLIIVNTDKMLLSTVDFIESFNIQK